MRDGMSVVVRFARRRRRRVRSACLFGGICERRVVSVVLECIGTGALERVCGPFVCLKGGRIEGI